MPSLRRRSRSVHHAPLAGVSSPSRYQGTPKRLWAVFGPLGRTPSGRSPHPDARQKPTGAGRSPARALRAPPGRPGAGSACRAGRPGARMSLCAGRRRRRPRRPSGSPDACPVRTRPGPRTSASRTSTFPCRPGCPRPRASVHRAHEIRGGKPRHRQGRRSGEADRLRLGQVSVRPVALGEGQSRRRMPGCPPLPYALAAARSRPFIVFMKRLRSSRPLSLRRESRIWPAPFSGSMASTRVRPSSS